MNVRIPLLAQVNCEKLGGGFTWEGGSEDGEEQV